MRQRFLTLALTILLGTFSAAAQDLPADKHQQTTPPPNARFEIIQSELSARWTFRLERYTGRVYQLVKVPDTSSTWQVMPMSPRPSPGPSKHAHFQIFTSGLAARHTFLMDTDSGFTWMLVSRMERAADGTEERIDGWAQIEMTENLPK